MISDLNAIDALMIFSAVTEAGPELTPHEVWMVSADIITGRTDSLTRYA